MSKDVHRSENHEGNKFEESEWLMLCQDVTDQAEIDDESVFNDSVLKDRLLTA